LVGLPFSLWLVGALAAILFAAGLARRSVSPFPPPLRPSRLALLVWAAVAGVLALLFVDVLYQPLWSADAWGIWAPKAKSIVVHDALNAEFMRSYPNDANYPVLLPSLEAIAYEASGRSTLLLDLQSWLLLAALPGALVALVRDRVPALMLASVGLALVVAPSVQIQTATALADLPLAIFVALAGLAAWRWLELSDWSALGLFALFAAAAFATKVEARLFVGALVAVAVVLAWRSSRRAALLTAGAGAVAALVAVVPWLAWTRRHDLVNYYTGGRPDRGDEESRVARVGIAAFRLVAESLDPTSWLLLGLVGAVAIVLGLRSVRARNAAVLVGATVLVSLAGLVWVYLNTPFRTVDSHLDHSARRIVTSLVLLAAVFAPVLLASADDDADGG
jgi:4-amino-4-deoxy-L-arabinose transferase-like glycosyltransferase